MRCLALFLLSTAALPLRTAALELYVSTSGSDRNPGSAASPFATLTHARDVVRDLKNSAGLSAEGVTVWLRSGTYFFSESAQFDERDSGTAGRPIVYASYPGEVARLSGARTLEPIAFDIVEETSPVWNRLPLPARGHVYVANLSERGIKNLGTFKTRGFGQSSSSPLELFIGGHPATLARWPNRSDELVNTLDPVALTQFAYAGTRPERWTHAPDLWMHGMWAFPWADFHLKVARIEPASKTIVLNEGPREFGLKPGQPYYAYNLLEELDEPGEYYVDRAAGLLYVWPLASVHQSEFAVSLLEDPVLAIKGARFLTFRDFTIEAGRGKLVEIDGGDHVRIEQSLLRNAGGCGAAVSGTSSGLDQCEIVDCDEEGVRLAGGNRASLTPGNNFVSNCRIHRVARQAWTYHPAILFLDGCGNLAEHNLIDDLPHSAILFSGNNHRIEANEIRRVCQITSDTGAIYTGRDWGYRGNLLRNNFIHHIRSVRPGEGAFGIYLDDAVSGIEVANNVFYEIKDCALFCGGGRDLIMNNNLMAHCGIAHANADYARAQINNRPGDPFNLIERLAADGIKYQEEPWASAYPACAAIPNSWDAIQQGLWRNPEHDTFDRNIGWANTVWMRERDGSHTGVFSVYLSVKDNEPSHPALFDDLQALDRSRRPAQLVGQVSGFEPIRFASIGRSYESWPAATEAPPAPELTGKAESANRVSLAWSDDGNLPRNQESGFTPEYALTREGPWKTAQALGPDTDFFTQNDLNRATPYFFRIHAFNAAGGAYSNILTIKTKETD